MINFDQSVCSDLAAATGREWLETNGIGGFAASTVCGMNRRRYHGLLVAATKPPVGRMVLLSKFEETLVVGERRMELGSNQYSGAVHPQGHCYFKSFRLDPFPVFTYAVDGIEIEKSVFMVQGSNTTVVQYKLLNAALGDLVHLELRPLVAFRDYHSTTHANDAIRKDFVEAPGLVSVMAYEGVPTLHFAHNADTVERAGNWYFNLEYDVERERGLDFHEDLFNPLVFKFLLTRTSPAVVIASTDVPSAQ